MYKAEITGKEFNNGMLSVIVMFTNDDDKDQVQHTFQTNQPQEGWIEDQIGKKIKDLNALTEQVGAIEVSAKFEDKVVENNNECNEFINDYHSLATINRLISLGILAEEYSGKAELLQRLKENFKPEYVKII